MMIKIIAKIIAVLLFCFLFSYLYCVETNNNIEFSIPVWFNTEFYVFISTNKIKIGFIYL